MKKMLIDFKNDDLWKKMIKISFICSFLGMSTFWFFIVILLADINRDKLFYIIFILITKQVLISYSLSIYIINSNEIQQQKYRYLWLFLFIIATNLLGIITMMLLIKQQNKQTNVMIENPQQEPKVNITKTEEIEPVIIENEEWILAAALCSSIVMMIFIVTIPILVINLINIKHNWKKALIDARTLKKITYFSHDIFLITIVKFSV